MPRITCKAVNNPNKANSRTRLFEASKLIPPQCRRSIIPFASDPETVQYLTNKIKLSGTRGEGGDITLIAKEMEKEHLLVKYIKKLQSKNSTQSK